MFSESPGVLLKKDIKVNIKITLGIILGILCLVTVLIYNYVPSIRDQLKFAMTVMGGAAAVYTGYYVAATLQTSIDPTHVLFAYRIQPWPKPQQ